MSLLSSHPLPRRKSAREGHYPDAFPARPTTAPPVDGWSAALLHGLEVATGAPVAFVESPTALDHSEGPWAFRCRLDRAVVWPDAGRDDTGSDELAFRLAPGRGSLECEAAVMREVRRQLNGAVRVHAVMPLGDGPDPLWALVRDEVGGVDLPELIGFNLHHSDALLRGFAARQAEIHAITLTERAGRALPVIDAEEEVARIDAPGLSKQRRWLDENRPEPSERVLCHGTYQPMSVFGPPPEDWDSYGGVGRGLVATNWCAAVMAEREFDVAYSLVALWSAPFFAKNRPERTAIKMIRNTLINTYKIGYEDAHPVDPVRVRFWEAFHVLRGIARMEGVYDSVHSPFAPPDRGVLPTELATELPRRFVQLTKVR